MSTETRLEALEAKALNSKPVTGLSETLSLNENSYFAVTDPNTGQLLKIRVGNIDFGSGTPSDNNIITTLKYASINQSSSIAYQTQIKDYVNSLPSFTTSGNEIVLFYTVRFFTDGEKYIVRDFYILNLGKGTYGSGQTQISEGDLLKLPGSENQSEAFENIQEDFGDIGSDSIVDAVNELTAFQLQPSNLNFFKAVQNGESETYLYVGQTSQNIGSGAYQTVSSDYISINEATPEPPSINTDFVQTTPQTLTPAQQIQALDNQGIKRIVVSGEWFTWHPYPRSTYNNVEVGDVASNGWGGQNTFVKAMIFTGGNHTDINNWEINDFIGEQL